MKLYKQLIALFLGLLLGIGASAAAAEVVAVVSAHSAVAVQIDRNEISDIFLGKSNRLPGGEPVVPIDQAESSTARDKFYQSYAGRSPAQVKAHWAKIIFTGRGQPPAIVPDDAEVKKRLAENPHAIGYINRKAVDDSVKVLSIQ